jgi:hypothetical protein
MDTLKIKRKWKICTWTVLRDYLKTTLPIDWFWVSDANVASTSRKEFLFSDSGVAPWILLVHEGHGSDVSRIFGIGSIGLSVVTDTC